MSFDSPVLLTESLHQRCSLLPLGCPPPLLSTRLSPYPANRLPPRCRASKAHLLPRVDGELLEDAGPAALVHTILPPHHHVAAQAVQHHSAEPVVAKQQHGWRQ